MEKQGLCQTTWTAEMVEKVAWHRIQTNSIGNNAPEPLTNFKASSTWQSSVEKLFKDGPQQYSCCSCSCYVELERWVPTFNIVPVYT